MRTTEEKLAASGSALRALSEYVLATLRDITGLSADVLKEATYFDEIGLESLAVTAFTGRLEPAFPGLKKTFMFECRSVRGVCEYLFEHHADDARALLATLQTNGREQTQSAEVVLDDGWPDFDAFERTADVGPVPIAVIGMHGRFPGASTPDALWELLAEARDAVGEIPANRWNMDAFFEPATNSRRTGKSYAKWGGFLDGVDRFDAQFFGISARDAAVMDPQERLFLECAWHAMENAALVGPRLEGLRSEDGYEVGVFVGVTTTSYQLLGPEGWHGPAKDVPTAMPWSVANRVSYALNLQGPSLAIDTACSSSLVAFHYACESLAKGECKAAIAGGVNLYTHPAKLVQLCQHSMLSPTGRCHTFGKAADGFAPGEGVGALILKPLEGALADGDRILAIIRATSVNHSGRTNGFTVPSARSQAALVARALASGGIAPESISYIEAHGTGTKLGDPIELAGLTEALAATGLGHPIGIGSVKSNIGHLESAAGTAGLIKTIQQLQRRSLAPSLHSRELNPALGIEETRFFVPQSLTPWQPEPGCGVLRAGISAFGAGGANAHAVLEEAPARAPGARPQGPLVFPLSARSPEQVACLARALAATLDGLAARPDGEGAFAALAYTLQRGRRAFPHRLALVAGDLRTLQHLLASAGEGAAGVFRGHVPAGSERQGLAGGDDDASLARRWVEGEDLDWGSCWTSAPEPVDAPLYPFVAERHWLQRDDESVAAANIVAQPRAFPFGVDVSGFADHRIGDEAVLPATACIGACYQFALQEGFGQSVEFERLSWLQPLTLARLGGERAELRVERSGSDLSFELVSGTIGPILHFRGRCRPGAGLSVAAGRLDVEAIRARCRPTVDMDVAYAAFRNLGMDYGPGFRALSAAWTGQREALVEVRLPAGRHANHPLDPAMLDGALQGAALAAGLLDGKLTTAFIPLSVSRIHLCDALPAAILVHVAERGDGLQVRTFDYRIAALDGVPLLDIEGFAFRSVAFVAREPEVSILQPDWVPTPLPERAPSALGPVVVFDGGRALVDALRSTGDDRTAVWHVIPGRRFEIAGDAITCDIADNGNLDLLWRYLVAEGGLPQQVVINATTPWPDIFDGHDGGAWRDKAGITEADLVPGILSSLSRASSVPRFHATIALARCGGGAALAGALKSLHLEASGISAGIVECEGLDDVAGTICDELCRAEWSGVTEVRRHPRGRETRRLRFADDWLWGGGRTLHFSGQDVIVVTGGAGAVAGHLMAAIAARAPVHFVLIGQSPHGGKVQDRIAALERLGARATYRQADCADAGRMAEILAAVRRELGPVTGVIHAAGLLKDAFLARQDRPGWDAVVTPKIAGALVLDELTVGDPLRFFVMCSGLAGVHGNIGQSAYAFANAWLDQFAERRAAQVVAGQRHGATTAIAWPLWDTGAGMQAPDHFKAWLARHGLTLLTPETGAAIFLDALVAARPVVIPVSGARADIARLLIDAKDAETNHAAPQRSKPMPVTQSTSAVEGVIGYLNGLIAEATSTGLDRIDPDAALEVFGLDSIMVMELNARLEERFPDIPKTALFEARSIRSLAELLNREFPAHAATFATVHPSPLVGVGQGERADAQEDKDGSTTRLTALTSPHPVPLPRGERAVAGDIAIVGIAGRYPGSKDLAEFWRHLAGGDDLVTEVSGRWDPDDAARHGLYARWGGFLGDVDAFDPLFFGISPRDAERMDPQERLFLQTAWHAVEDAGYTPETLSGPRDAHTVRRRVGVIAGVMYGEYQFYGASAGLAAPPVITNSSYASIANRVSFCLDLDGPSFAVDSMCSSSLTALHLACELLRGGGCDIALAGGVNLSLHPYKYRTLCDLKFASTDGRCRSFGHGGDGYVPGEGVGVAILRPLHDAVRAGDHVYGVIKGSDIGHGARTSGYTVPNPEAQADVIRRAFDRSGVDPRNLGYVEAHGTGTGLGDPIEVRGLVNALGSRLVPGQTCPIGSVKSNIGHLESAAGMAALSKVLLQLRHDCLAPSIHSGELNRNIDFAATPFRVVRSPRPWRRNGSAPRLAAISSFGAGGANAHLVIEEHVGGRPVEIVERRPHVFVLSARGDKQLAEMAMHLAEHLEREMTAHGDGDPARLGREGYSTYDVAMTLAQGRRAHNHRLAIVADDFPDLAAKLRRAPGGDGGDVYTGVLPDGAPASAATAGIAADVRERARAWVAGRTSSPVDDAGPSWRRVPLPGYAFLKRRYWVANGFGAPPRSAGKGTVSAALPASISTIRPMTDPGPTQAPASSPTRKIAMASPRIGIIGGGASGIGTAKALHQAGYEFEIIEATERFGGNWLTTGPAAKMYDSVHLISSKRNTQFSDHPMPKAYPHYPRHGLMLSYLEEMARDFDLERRARFNTTVTDARPADGGWNVQFQGGGSAQYDILIVCNGLLRKPVTPVYPGHFAGQSLHAEAYRSADLFRGRRVLVVGGGNSGCDIAVDAAIHAKAAFHSTRRGYYYMPKFIDGRPTQEWLMDEASRFQDPDAYWDHVRSTFKLAGYDGQDYGLPAPDHKIQEAHPILNSQILYHIGHGDVTPKPDIARLDGTRIHFTDGTSETIDVIVWATGYDIDLPFLSPEVYDWRARFPSLFLKMVPQEFDNLVFAGYLNTPSGIGNVANIMGKFVAAYVHARTHRTESWHAFQSIKMDPDALDLGEARFMDTPRHKFEVDLWKFIKALNFVTGRLLESAAEPERPLERAVSS